MYGRAKEGVPNKQPIVARFLAYVKNYVFCVSIYLMSLIPLCIYFYISIIRGYPRVLLSVTFSLAVC